MSQLARKFFTVIYEISDQAAFQGYLEKTTSLLASGEEEAGATVVGCGFGDSMTEADAFGDALMEMGIDQDEVLEKFLEDSGCIPDGMKVEDLARAVRG